MSFKNKKLVIILSIVLLIFSLWALNEAKYINKLKLQVPIEYKGELKLRQDGYGKGYFGAHRNGKRKHNGIDLLAEVGTPVLAARSGRVINAEKKRGIGKYVEIRHSKGLVTIYGHLSEILVKTGQRVKQGQIIGKVGKTGNANYKNMLSHLHFEIRENNIPQDPKKYSDELGFSQESNEGKAK
jgi:murein DD-endopeptidase MepM/ murein hydrolase activator NlpD